MEANGLKEKLGEFQKEITYYSQMQIYSSNPYDKKYYEDLIQSRTERLTVELTEILSIREEENEHPVISAAQEQGTESENTSTEQPPPEGQAADKVFTVSELAGYDGSQGRPAYVAVNGIVYDVTDRPPWAGGMHFAGLRAGKDLTAQFTSCHRGMESVLTQLPVVGTLASETSE
ncbi:cytochrome b5 domain-containing protein [Anaerocolumna sp. AGMB13020]|uniref:cytochrome b5 domain-containing protein n=1 Tax=Anaerocolumna sp. AGMB13020 TaxID=3081750 RepID=UPI0029539F21|nr:cytochrome b5 domain-containing protein [Anaerocolumna sp. AGMB13020]WOO38357.1 cytochrome b5 domain-containing protein [Anaerocolumna sp. AGMB13020]